MESEPGIEVLPSSNEQDGRVRDCANPKSFQPPRVRALEQIRRMRGGSQSHLMRCSDGHYYVVKFLNNPQGARVVRNELLAHGIASALGLPIPPCALVNVGQELIELTTELRIERPREYITCPCAPGMGFGSRWAANTWDIPFGLPPGPVENLEDFWGMCVFDVWVCNLDGRQVIFTKTDCGYYRMSMIDNGFCFSAEEWTTHVNSRKMALFQGLHAYTKLKDTRSIEQCLSLCEPCLSLIENGFSVEGLQSLTRSIPSEWLTTAEPLEPLLAALNSRRSLVRHFLEEALCSYLRTNMRS